MRILALDVGQQRIGLAISDGLGLTAQGLSTLTRKDIEKDLCALREIIRAHKVKEIVVGLPLNMDGTLGKKAKEVVDFVGILEQRLGYPVKVWDERLTTLEAEATLLAADLSRKKRRKVVDRLAAQLILQSYLDAKRSSE